MPCPIREDVKLAISINPLLSPVEPLKVDYDRERFEDIGYMTCMTLVLLGNYAQTGHFGGPLAYTPYNVGIHLAGQSSVGWGMTTVIQSIHSGKKSCWPVGQTILP